MREERWSSFGSFLLAAALVSLGSLWQAGAGALPEARGRVVVVGVGGMSSPPLLAGEVADADLVAAGRPDPAEVLASVVTGKFAHQHGVRRPGDAFRFRADRAGPHRPAWELLSRRGHAVAVIGFPHGSPIEAPESLVVPDWTTFSARRRVWEGGEERPLPEAWQHLLVEADHVAEPLLERMLDGASLSPVLTATLREALAADLGLLALADAVARSRPGTHVFLYLEGPAGWEERVAREAPAEAARLASGGHEIVEHVRARLAALDDGETTFVLFSDQGSPRDAVAHRDRPTAGWLAAWGRGIERDPDLMTLAPVDLTPTLLHLTGNPIPIDIDGVVAFGLLHDDLIHRHRVRFVATD